MNLDLEVVVDDILNINLEQKKISERYTMAWFTHKDLTSNKGFELMFTADKWAPISELSSEFYSQNAAQFQSFSLKMGSVGKKGAMVAFYARRDILSLEQKEYGMFGYGVEFVFGGHPALTQMRNRWPVSLTFGASASYQQRPAFIDEDVWELRKKEDNITSGYNTVYLNLALQRLAHRKGISFYIKFEIDGSLSNYRLLTQNNVYLAEENTHFVIKGGLSLGVLF